jgi:aspartate/methionine/tyrosine aminotransferase
MDIEEFALERIQSLYENEVELNLSDSGVHPYDEVELNLSDSGVHPYDLRTLLSAEELDALLDVELGYGHTHGSPELRRAIAALYADRSEDEVLVTTGGVEANFLLVMTLVAPGEKVVVVTPNYLQIAGWARAAGGDVREVPLRADAGWSLDRAALDAVLAGGARLVTLCVPNNPTGTVLDADDRAWLVARAAEAGAWLHVDEVYAGSDMDGEAPPSWADDGDHVLVTNSLSKTMALPGLRLGWLVGPAAEIYRAWQRKDYTSITTSALSEAIAELVLEPGRRAAIQARSRDWLRANRDLLADWVAERDDFSFTVPTAGGMAFIGCDVPVTTDEFAELLRAGASVLVVPGSCYGLEGHIRIGIGAPPAVLRAGLERIGALADSLRAASQGSSRA